MKQELWKEVDGERQFLIPSGIPLEAGNLSIENRNGQQLLVSEHAVYEYLASAEQIDTHQDQQINETVNELGKAFGSLFDAGKNIFQQALQDMEKSSESEDSISENDDIPDNVIDLETEEKADKGDFFSEMRDIFGSAKGEFRGIIDEAKKELQQSLQDPEMIEIIRNLGHQIVDLADTLELSEESTVSSLDLDEIQESKSTPSPKDEQERESIETNEEPPVVSLEPDNTPENNNDEAPPSPLSDDE